MINPQMPSNMSMLHCLSPLGSANARVEDRWRGLETDRAIKEMNVHHMAK